jgi:hypothetical protein
MKLFGQLWLPQALGLGLVAQNSFQCLATAEFWIGRWKQPVVAAQE